MKKLADIRKAQLQKLIDETSLAEVARRLGKPDRQLNDMLANRKSFGEKVARNMEENANPVLPKYYFEGEFGPPTERYDVDQEKINETPVVGKSMGGLPDRLFTDEGRPINGHDEYADLYSSDVGAFVVRIDGSSMLNKYEPGGFALVEPNTDIDVGDDVLIKTTISGVMLKKLISRKGGVTLSSYNETTEYIFQPAQIIWMYYVAYPVPAKKIKQRI